MMLGMGWMMLGMGLFWLVLIVVAILIVKALFTTGSGKATTFQQDPSTPLEILELRYSRGEITREQYLQMKKDLGL